MGFVGSGSVSLGFDDLNFLGELGGSVCGEEEDFSVDIKKFLLRSFVL